MIASTPGVRRADRRQIQESLAEGGQRYVKIYGMTSDLGESGRRRSKVCQDLWNDIRFTGFWQKEVKGMSRFIERHQIQEILAGGGQRYIKIYRMTSN